MKYIVAVTSEAQRSIDDAVDWYSARSIEVARRWLDAAERAIDHLEVDPHRFPAVREVDRFGRDVRQVNFGGGSKLTHRMVFVIRGDRVVIYAVRHLAQRDMDQSE